MRKAVFSALPRDQEKIGNGNEKGEDEIIALSVQPSFSPSIPLILPPFRLIRG